MGFDELMAEGHSLDDLLDEGPCDIPESVRTQSFDSAGNSSDTAFQEYGESYGEEAAEPLSIYPSFTTAHTDLTAAQPTFANTESQIFPTGVANYSQPNVS